MDFGLDTRRPFSREEALAAGITPDKLRSTAYTSVFRCVYVAGSVRVTPELRVAAALKAFGPRAFASHVSAARIYGAPIPAFADEHISVATAADRRERAGIKVHVAAAADVRVVRGLRVSAPARMFVELAGLLPLVDLVIVGDWLVKRGLTDPPTLRQTAGEGVGGGAGAARTAAALVRSRVDSPMETRTRLLLVLAGLPEPELNVEVRNHLGDVVRRYDLLYRRSRTVLEYHGRHHFEGVDQGRSDVIRREATEDDGHRMVVITSHDVHVDPESFLLRVQRILVDRGEPGVPRRLSDAWRPHFPGRRPY